MNHSNRLAGRRGHQVDFLIDLFQRMLQHHHGEDGCTGRHIAGSGCNCIGSGHTRSRVTFCRSKGNARRQQIIQHRGTGIGQLTSVLACNQNRRQDIGQVLPGKILSCHQRIKLGKHGFIVTILFTVNGEHAGCFPDADGIDTGEHIVDIACQGGNVGNSFHMFLAI